MSSMKNLFTILTIALFLAGTSTRADDNEEPRILAIGDSLIAWHMLSGQSITDAVSEELEEPAISRAVGGARVLFNLPGFAELGARISSQYVEGDWDWVIMNGGGNDLWFGCGCKSCDAKLDKLINLEEQTGGIPKQIDKALESGAKVLWVGYLRSPGVKSIISECREEGDELEARIAAYAEGTDDLHFLSIADLVPEGDLTFHGVDRIHPSLKASRVIGERVAELIRKVDPDR